MTHQFGGIWTKKKLEILESYLSAYCLALKNQSFTLHYADAFAGTGKIKNHKNPHYEPTLFSIPIDDLRGSVVTALEVKPGFHQYHFNDINPQHVAALREIKKQHPQKNITLSDRDANEFVIDFCASLNRKDRAVLFVDPYSTQLHWNTLEVVAKTGKIDLWLLFPLSALLRMTPKSGAKIIPEWKPKINQLLGTDQWEKALYKPRNQLLQFDIFAGHADHGRQLERENPEELQRWVVERVSEIFAYVARPVMLKNRGAPLFSFIFAVSNPNQQAWGLAQRIAESVIKKHT